MSWNLIHNARMIQKNGGIDAMGNHAAKWREFTNAKDQDPEQKPAGWDDNAEDLM